MTVSVSQLDPDDVIGGRYRVSRLIGTGGMGAVYAAENTNSGRAVALKVIKAGLDQTPDQRRRFLREAKAATAIQHPNVIEVLDVFEDDDGTLVMVMELLEGETLKEHRKNKGALTLTEAAQLFLPVVEALKAAHDKGIVHRDLKPENVFLSRGLNGVVKPKVLDFGIAKVLDPDTLNSETHGGETATGSLLGTPHYMSFEQAMSEKSIDQRTDVWSMGVMIFEALTGRRPIEFANLGEMYTQFLTGQVPKIASLIPDLPRDAAAAVDGCLVKQRDGRHADLTPLLTVLGHYADPDVPGGNRGGRVVSDIEIGEAKLSTISAGNAEVMSERPREGRSRPAKLITAAATVVVVSALAGYGLRKQRAESVAAESVAGTAAGTASDAPAESSSADVGESSPLNVSASQPIEPSARASATASSPRPHSMSVQPPPLVPTASATALNTTASAAPSGEKKKGIVEELPY